MKALIFNSGMGTRMGQMTASRPKCMLPLYNGETILARQLRLLSQCGIREIVITTGPNVELIEQTVALFPGISVTLVENPDYRTTNYIVSMDRAASYLDDDVLLLHGDLVFNRELVQQILYHEASSLCLYNQEKPLPEKDFSASFVDGRLDRVGVGLSGVSCYAFQPLYKLDRETARAWFLKVGEFVAAGKTTVYAENALNEITGELNIQGMSYSFDYIEEIDNAGDYARVSQEIAVYDQREQECIITDSYCETLKKLLNAQNTRRVFAVSGKSGSPLVQSALAAVGCDYIIFSDFSANPLLEEAENGSRLFALQNYDVILAMGGGSALDVAKMIKRNVGRTGISLIAIPTTAGSGSEATRFAVCYQEGQKLSFADDAMLPDAVILDYQLLKTLPEYHLKVSLLDAMCQAIESYWARGANTRSRNYAKQALQLILKYYPQYLVRQDEALKAIQFAAYLSGRAINISKTTLPHAMSYGLTTRYGIGHGHGVGLCMLPVWQSLAKAALGTETEAVLHEINLIFECAQTADSIERYCDIYRLMELPSPPIKSDDIAELAGAVNPERLANHPVKYDTLALAELYRQIISNTVE